MQKYENNWWIFSSVVEKGVEGTSVTLVSTRSSRSTTRIEGEEEVKMASTTDVGHRNESHVHLWSQGKDEEEEDYDERREREELMALLRPVSISGHHAPSPLVRSRPEQKPTVDESNRTKKTSRDPEDTTTDFQWTIEWTPSVDVFRHQSSTSSSVSFYFIFNWPKLFRF